MEFNITELRQKGRPLWMTELGEESRRLQGEVQFLGALIAANAGQKAQALGFANLRQVCPLK